MDKRRTQCSLSFSLFLVLKSLPLFSSSPSLPRAAAPVVSAARMEIRQGEEKRGMKRGKADCGTVWKTKKHPD